MKRSVLVLWGNIFLHISCSQLRRIEQAQNALNENNAMLNVLSHLGRPGDGIAREVLAFLAAILFAGNESVQVSY